MHEKEIMNIIEKSMPDGINVRGIIKKGISPSTVKKYLDVLENEKKFIFHEKIKNSDVYMIRQGDQISYSESHAIITQTMKEFEDVIYRSIEYASKWGISEQLEVYQHVVNVITLMKYFKQLATDIVNLDDSRIPQDIEDYVNHLDEISRNVNQKFNILLTPLAMIQLQNTMGESMEYLESIAKRKRRKGRKSKHIEKVLKDMANNSKLKDTMKDLEELSKSN